MPAKKATAVSKPTYAIMVHESIKSIGDRTGSSVQAITKQLQAQYNIEINKPALIKAIKKGVENGDLVQIKASYKLGKKTPAPKPKKATTTTVVIKKKVTTKPKTTSRSVRFSSSLHHFSLSLPLPVRPFPSPFDLIV